VTGPIALHGGGEFLPGDEPFLAAILQRAPRSADGTIHAVVVPTAAARGRPDLAAANGVAALQRIGAAESLTVDAVAARVVDATSAGNTTISEKLSVAELVYLPGGDPDLIPSLLPGTRAWAAIRDAHLRGAVLAGASAGAMALAARTWTAGGAVEGLGLVPGLAVVPHADAASWARMLAYFEGRIPPDIGLLGLAERTGVIGRPGESWRVIGEGEVRWLAPGSTRPLVAADGDEIRLEP
jgi:cyanophycinase-like exopeptidase